MKTKHQEENSLPAGKTNHQKERTNSEYDEDDVFEASLKLQRLDSDNKVINSNSIIPHNFP